MPQLHTLALSRDPSVQPRPSPTHKWPHFQCSFWKGWEHVENSLSLPLSVFWVRVFNGRAVVNPVTSGANTATHLQHNQNTPKSTKNNQSQLGRCCFFYCANQKEVTFHTEYFYLRFKPQMLMGYNRTVFLLWIKTLLKSLPAPSSASCHSSDGRVDLIHRLRPAARHDHRQTNLSQLGRDL